MVPETGRRFLPQQLAPGTYVQMFEVLLWCEEFKISYVSSIDTPRHHRTQKRTDRIWRSLTYKTLELSIGTHTICQYFPFLRGQTLTDSLAFLSPVSRRVDPAC